MLRLITAIGGRNRGNMTSDATDELDRAQLHKTSVRSSNSGHIGDTHPRDESAGIEPARTDAGASD